MVIFFVSKTGKSLSQSKQNTLVRVIFWMFQAARILHEFYKNPKNRKINLSWQHLLSKPKEFFHIRNCIKNLKTEILHSSLSSNEKQKIIQYIDEVGKEMFDTTQKFIHNNYENFKINDVNDTPRRRASGN